MQAHHPFQPIRINVSIHTFFSTADYPYERKDYGDLERVMINFFDWNLLVPTAATFLEYYAEKLISEGPDEYFKNGRKQLLHGQVSLARLAFEFLDITLWGTLVTSAAPVKFACNKTFHSSNFDR